MTCPVRAGNPKIVSGHDGREMNSSHAQNSEMTRDASYRARSRCVASRIRQNLRIDVHGCVLKVSGALFTSSIGHDDVPHCRSVAECLRNR